MLPRIAHSAAWTSSRTLRRTTASQFRFSSTSTSSSNEKPSSSSQVYLNTERKRKLISLYHQAENFITYDNLSDKIDEEFARFCNGINEDSVRVKDARKDLAAELEERQERSKLIAPSPGGQLRWSYEDNISAAEKADLKERRVKAALFGLDESFKAGLEAVEEKGRDIRTYKDLSDTSR